MDIFIFYFQFYLKKSIHNLLSFLPITSISFIFLYLFDYQVIIRYPYFVLDIFYLFFILIFPFSSFLSTLTKFIIILFELNLHSTYSQITTCHNPHPNPLKKEHIKLNMQTLLTMTIFSNHQLNHSSLILTKSKWQNWKAYNLVTNSQTSNIINAKWPTFKKSLKTMLSGQNKLWFKVLTYLNTLPKDNILNTFGLDAQIQEYLPMKSSV